MFQVILKWNVYDWSKEKLELQNDMEAIVVLTLTPRNLQDSWVGKNAWIHDR